MRVCLLLIVCIAAVMAATRQDRVPHTSYRRYVQMLRTINSSPALMEEWRKHMALSRDPIREKRWLSGYDLNCNGEFRSASRPTSVHKLRPGDIDVVTAIGDSLTAGNGILAWTILGCLTEYRGRSWSIGGDKSLSEGVSTLPNIMRQFNPNLRGFSLGSGDANSRGANLNQAVAGAIAQDMPTQADTLIQKMQSDPDVDFANDWKMVTLFIGGNNLCAFCDDLNAHSAQTYIDNVAQALDMLRDRSPRTFVNLVEIFDIAPVAGLGDGVICSLVHGAVCGCGHGADADTAALSALSREYQRVTQELVMSGRYDGRDDFTVVLQPFFRETAPPNKSDGTPDLSYFAPDCFHFSAKGHNIAGKALWNTMMSGVGSKQTDWTEDAPIQCPSKTYIPTKMN